MIKIDIPFIVVATDEKEECFIMTPTDALSYLKKNGGDDILFLQSADLHVGLQKLLDLLIEHPQFFQCLDIALQATPRQRKIRRLIKSAKNEPEN